MSPADPYRVHLSLGEADGLPEALLTRAVEATLRGEGVAEAEVSVTLLDDEAMAELNERYLGRDGPTDVISFSLGDDTPLGDVYVGVEQARRQATEVCVPLTEELVRLVVHGTLHVLGHDHPEGPERVDSPMFARQEELVRALVGASDVSPGAGASR